MNYDCEESCVIGQYKKFTNAAIVHLNNTEKQHPSITIDDIPYQMEVQVVPFGQIITHRNITGVKYTPDSCIPGSSLVNDMRYTFDRHIINCLDISNGKSLFLKSKCRYVGIDNIIDAIFKQTSLAFEKEARISLHPVNIKAHLDAHERTITFIITDLAARIGSI